MALPYRNSKKNQARTYILIGDGFDEYEVIYFLHKFRRHGLPIKSVSLFDRLVFSRQGVGIKADYSLADQPFDPVSNCILILPSGGRNGDKLRRDARVKSLLRQFNTGQGKIVLTDGESDLAVDVGQMMTARPPFLPRINEPLEDFVETLTDRMV
jgi:hypothetical protein